jgi:hypothetical protein
MRISVGAGVRVGVGVGVTVAVGVPEAVAVTVTGLSGLSVPQLSIPDRRTRQKRNKTIRLKMEKGFGLTVLIGQAWCTE